MTEPPSFKPPPMEVVELPAGTWQALTAILAGMSHMALPPQISVGEVADFVMTMRNAKVGQPAAEAAIQERV